MRAADPDIKIGVVGWRDEQEFAQIPDRGEDGLPNPDKNWDVELDYLRGTIHQQLLDLDLKVDGVGLTTESMTDAVRDHICNRMGSKPFAWESGASNPGYPLPLTNEFRENTEMIRRSKERVEQNAKKLMNPVNPVTSIITDFPTGMQLDLERRALEKTNALVSQLQTDNAKFRSDSESQADEITRLKQAEVIHDQALNAAVDGHNAATQSSQRIGREKQDFQQRTGVSLSNFLANLGPAPGDLQAAFHGGTVPIPTNTVTVQVPGPVVTNTVHVPVPAPPPPTHNGPGTDTVTQATIIAKRQVYGLAGLPTINDITGTANASIPANAEGFCKGDFSGERRKIVLTVPGTNDFIVASRQQLSHASRMVMYESDIKNREAAHETARVAALGGAPLAPAITAFTRAPGHRGAINNVIPADNPANDKNVATKALDRAGGIIKKAGRGGGI